MATEISFDEGKIISTLAEGIDPFTGELLPSGHLLQNAQVVRALFHAASALDQEKKSAKRAATLPAKAGKTWSKDEEALLIKQFDDKTAIQDIAKQHGRTEAGITSRLVKLGKISADAYSAGKPGRAAKANAMPGAFGSSDRRTSERIRQ